MDLTVASLLVVFGVMALNQMLMRLGGIEARFWIFWGLQAINLAVGTLVLALGLPGFEQLPVISWFVGLVFFLRTILNTNARAAWLRERQIEEKLEETKKRAALRASIKDEAP